MKDSAMNFIQLPVGIQSICGHQPDSYWLFGHVCLKKVAKIGGAVDKELVGFGDYAPVRKKGRDGAFVLIVPDVDGR